jgi:hypothetical protein
VRLIVQLGFYVVSRDQVLEREEPAPVAVGKEDGE